MSWNINPLYKITNEYDKDYNKPFLGILNKKKLNIPVKILQLHCYMFRKRELYLITPNYFFNQPC